MTPEEAEAALQAWATVERDEIIQAAYRDGVSKNRIHVITGLARTTIDRILESQLSATQDDLAEYLGRFTMSWPRPQLWDWQPPMALGIASQHTPREVAGWLLRDAEFRAMKLGTWLNTPSGEFFALAVQTLAPPPYDEDAALLIEALQLAAMHQQSEAREKVAAGLALAGIAVAAIGAARA